jgi:acyl-CoA ligase (AMP-forming) (exosortase A-associated)
MLTFTVYDLLAKNVPANANRPALIFGGATLTYGELAARVESTAAWLHAAGVARGDRVGIHLPKSFEEVIATFAIARIGAVFVNINYQWTTNQLEFIVKDAGIKVLFTDARRAKAISELPLARGLDAVVVRGAAPTAHNMTGWDSFAQIPCAVPDPSIDADLAGLFYTSGSTGKPKGVMFTHRNILLGARIVAKYLNNTAADRVLSLLPLGFDYGFNQITTMFLVGGSVVLQPVSLPAEIVKTVATNQVTGVALVAPSWVQVVRYLEEAPAKFPALRYITNSGGKIPLSALQLMPGLFPGVEIFLMYGLTEAFRSTFLPPLLFQSKMGSIGRAIPNTEIFVVDPERGICGPGQQGELIHRGGLISRGYWNNPAATNEKIKVNKHLQSLIGDEKVVHSGDLVRLDDDGYLWFVSRMDSMIKCSGYRLSPTEVEEAVSGCDHVIETVAFGVDDEELGQVVHVAVAVEANGDFKVEDLHHFCVKNMPSYMVPKQIHVHPGNMPRTSNGKIDRQTVIQQCLEGVLSKQQ